MSRRTSLITQADVARVFRVAKREGAEAIEVRRDGTILVHLKSQAPIVPADIDPFTKWETEYEARKNPAGNGNGQ